MVVKKNIKKQKNNLKLICSVYRSLTKQLQLKVTHNRKETCITEGKHRNKCWDCECIK